MKRKILYLLFSGLIFVLIMSFTLSGSFMVFATETKDGWIWVDEKDSKFFSLNGKWETWSETGLYGGSEYWSLDKAVDMTFTFTGTQFRILAPVDATQGVMDVYVDGKLAETVDCNKAEVVIDEFDDINTKIVYESSTLDNKEHKVMICPSRDEEAWWAKAAIDAVLYKGSAGNQGTQAPATSAPATSAPSDTDDETPKTADPAILSLIVLSLASAAASLKLKK